MARSYDLLDPFGQPECEQEILALDGREDRYKEIFFVGARFNEPAIAEESYLIIGRRGSGKTALSHFFSFQNSIPEAQYIDVNEPKAYREVIEHLTKYSDAEPREFIIPHLAAVWETIIWLTIIEYLRAELEEVANTIRSAHKDRRISLSAVFEKIRDLIVPPDIPTTAKNLASLHADGEIERAKAKIFQSCAERPLIIAIDTLEQHDVTKVSMLNAVAALIHFASDFHAKYAHRGLHLKVFVSGEVFPFLQEQVILNPLKNVKHPVHLLWRPKDLLRLICWRLYKRLNQHHLLLPESLPLLKWNDKAWENSKDVFEKMWVPYFGRWVKNFRDQPETTFSYLLRHTQMRPRQLIVLCNKIANLALKEGNFPRFQQHQIREGVRAAENDLAVEVINAYSSIYPHAGKIVEALSGCDNIFPARELDRRAKETASHWHTHQYSLYNFRRFAVELGIVGRVNRRNDTSGYVDADFEYSLEGRLSLAVQDECVIHPMFYQRLNTTVKEGIKIMPFSTEREIPELPEVE